MSFSPEEMDEMEEMPFSPVETEEMGEMPFSPVEMGEMEEMPFSPVEMDVTEEMGFFPMEMEEMGEMPFSPVEMGEMEEMAFSPLEMEGMEEMTFSPVEEMEEMEEMNNMGTTTAIVAVDDRIVPVNQKDTRASPEKQFQNVSTLTDIEIEEKYLPCQNNVAIQVHGDTTTSAQTWMDYGQQMEKTGYYPSEANDRYIVSRPYLTFDLLQKKRERAAIIIQKYWRRILGIRERLRREDSLMKRVQWAERLRMGRLEDRQRIIDKEIERQQNPTRLVDLELLYRAINVWRKEQEDWVSKNRWGGEKKAALAILSDIESDLLLDLERTKNRINVQERENRILRYFDAMGKPKRWLSEKSKNFISLDDDGRRNARKLTELYLDLQEPVARTLKGAKVRCDLLAKINTLTKDVNSTMSRTLTDLISRELIFLRSPKCSRALLSGVRRRISSIFYFLCQDPNFNPEAKRVDKIPHDLTKLRRDMIQCIGCRRMRNRDQFTIVKGTTITNRCLTCTNLYRTAILRMDLNLYRHMLSELRREEFEAGVVNSATFLMDAFDLKFLVDEIWHGQSALSGIDNRYILRLCRWTKEKPWAPWNCVLLSDEEATAHLHIGQLEDAYKDTFFHKVLVKQATAKTYFQGIAKLMVGLDERIKENCEAIEAKKKKTDELKVKLQKRMKVLATLSLS